MITKSHLILIFKLLMIEPPEYHCLRYYAPKMLNCFHCHYIATQLTIRKKRKSTNEIHFKILTYTTTYSYDFISQR